MALLLHEVYFGYDRQVLRGITLAVQAGEIVALLGPNGTGKSTLLAIAHGALHPQTGEVLFDGQPLNRFSRRELASRIAVVAQSSEVRFPLTALEYVLTGRFAHSGALGFDSPHDLEVAMKALTDTDAAQFAERQFNELDRKSVV